MKKITYILCFFLLGSGFSYHSFGKELTYSTASYSHFYQQKPQITVYPNPASSKINVSSIGLKIKAIEIFDVLGKKVITIDSNSVATIEIDIQDLSNGVYILKVTDSTDSTFTKKVVKR